MHKFKQRFSASIEKHISLVVACYLDAYMQDGNSIQAAPVPSGSAAHKLAPGALLAAGKELGFCAVAAQTSAQCKPGGAFTNPGASVDADAAAARGALATAATLFRLKPATADDDLGCEVMRGK